MFLEDYVLLFLESLRPSAALLRFPERDSETGDLEFGETCMFLVIYDVISLSVIIKFALFEDVPFTPWTISFLASKSYATLKSLILSID